MHIRYASAPRAILHTLAVVFASGLHAQPYYTFSQAAEPYLEISGGTAVTFSGGFGQISALNGETFQIMGEPFTFGGARQLWVLDGGALNIDYAPVNTVFLSGMFQAFGGLVPVDGTSSVKYLVTGPAGDRHLTVQWKNMRRADGSAGHYVNFQMVMHQASGVMELHYGVHYDGDATYTAANGPNAGFYFADYNATELYDRIWLSGDPVEPALSTALTPSFTGLSSMPPSWTVYRFTPAWFNGIAEATAQADLFSAATDPESGAFVVVFKGSEGGMLTLRDLQGRTIGTAARTTDRMQFGSAALPASVYLIEYRTTGGGREVMRVVKP
jgi:hypothetical protein